jgi:catechol 2,3-dioxygenase-like lactoylglutathione lyase family enzyme
VSTDARPNVWVGHVTLATPDPAAASAFYVDLGMREVETNRHVCVLELRGGTHLVLYRAKQSDIERGAAVPFDLMVDDLDAVHANLSARGLSPSGIAEGRIHRSFTVLDSDGYVLTVNSSHVVGAV